MGSCLGCGDEAAYANDMCNKCAVLTKGKLNSIRSMYKALQHVLDNTDHSDHIIVVEDALHDAESEFGKML